MLRPDRSIGCVYLHRAPIDMRRQMNGLAALVEGVLKQNPFSGSLFVFTNKRRDKLKMLVWDRSGFMTNRDVGNGGVVGNIDRPFGIKDWSRRSFIGR